jgi:hypothetical protein
MPSKKKAKSSPELTSALQHLLAKPSVDAERRMEEWEKSNDCGTIVLPLSMLDALKLAKDEGRKVRPCCWPWTPESRYVMYRAGLFVEHGNLDEIPHRLDLQREDELLGPWEVVQ